jgi:transmembrane sensor
MIAGDRDDRTASLKRQARRWVTQLVSGEARTADFQAAARWRSQSSAHDAAFNEATRLWRNFGPATRGLLVEEGPPVWSPPPSQMGRRAILGGAGVLATAAAVYAVIDPPLGLWPSLAELRADYRTATGEQRHVVLADDVSVRMNTQTSIAVPTAINGRDQVTLIDGEASFSLPPGSAKSLMVVAEAGRTIASRARFDVRNIGANVCVTCFEGEVQVELGVQKATVSASQQLRYDRAGLGQAATINAAEASAWQDGVLIFRFTPLSDVVTEINRYRPGRVILLNATLGTKTVNGRFLIQRIDEILVWIEQVLGATPRSLPGGVLLLS